MAEAVAEAPTIDMTEAASAVKGLFDEMQGEMPKDPRFEAGRSTVTTAPPTEAKSPGEVEVEKQQQEKKPEEVSKEKTESEGEATETDDAPPATDEKGRYRWGELKKEVKTLRTTKAELEQKLQQAGEASERLKQREAELQSVQKQIEEANRELFVHRVEATSEWKKAVQEPLDQVFEGVDSLARLGNIEGDKLYQAVAQLAKGDLGPLRGLLEGMDADMAGDIRADARDLAKNMVAIQKRAQDLKANSKEAYETSIRSQQELSQKQQQEQIQQYEKAASSIGEKFKETLSKLLPEDASPDYTRMGMESQKIDTWTPELKVYAGHAAAVMPELVRLSQSQAAKIKEMTAELAKFRNGAPKANTTGTAPSSPQEAKKQPTRDELAATSFDDFAAQLTSSLSR